MRSSQILAVVFSAVVALSLAACGESDPPEPVEEAQQAGVEAVHGLECKAMHATIEEYDGYDIPGVGGEPRRGMPEGEAGRIRVRKSYSSLTDAEKKQVAEAFLALKRTPYDYPSFCEALGLEEYEKNLYDYFVETHVSAFMSMKTLYMDHTQMPHMGPQFAPWHRYLLLRLESQMAEAVGDPGFTLPYWDWNDCGARDAENPDANPCPKVFEDSYLGSAGTCDDSTVGGWLIESGFESQIFTSPGFDAFRLSSIACGARALEREVGCSDLAPLPAQGAQITAIFDRTVYDASPYDSCDTDENVSFRQYLEGFTTTDVHPICLSGGCLMHGQGHGYISGDMSNGGAAPNDPMFFLHHVNVDRLWAEWQAHNLDNGRTDDHGNPGYPEEWRGGLFIWGDVAAEEMFDHRALGFTYDTLAEGS